MKENIILKEQDLFNYVFFKRQVDENKRLLMEKSRYNFNFSLLNSIKDSISENLPVFIKVKIKKRVKCYTPVDKFYLSLIKELKQPDNFPADQTEKIPVSKSTFIDDNNVYLIRLINYESTSRIFLFSRDEERINNFTLVLNPAKELFNVKNNLLPLEIDHQVSAASIELVFD